MTTPTTTSPTMETPTTSKTSRDEPRDTVDDGDAEVALQAMFEEPDDFRPPPPPHTIETFLRETTCVRPGEPASIVVRLVPSHSLWAHKLWNAGLSLARYLDRNKQLCEGQCVLELGAAAAIPTIVAAFAGARVAVATDYPDAELVDNIRHNLTSVAPTLVESGVLRGEGYLWGSDASKLLEILPTNTTRYDLVLLSDLVFNHTEHTHLIESSLAALSQDGVILTTFTHHIVKWADRNMKFFDIARDKFNLRVEKLYEERWDPMFPEDPGDENVRATVYCYRLTRQ